MLDTFTVAFFGHREIEYFQETERALEKLIESLMREHEYVEFLVGRNGEFDQLTASTVRSVRNRLGFHNSSLTLVLPYMTAEFRDNEESYREYFDEIEIFSGTHYKSAFQQRNRDMVSRSHLAIFAVNKTEGGAYSTMKYATAQGIETINLYDILEEER